MPLPKSLQCWATAAPGTEQILAHELRGLGITPGDSEPGGVEFLATTAQLADCAIQLRTANRVAVRLATFEARALGELERRGAKVPWEEVVKPGGAVHFRVTSKQSKLYHEDAIAERLERAVGLLVKGAHGVRAAAAAETLESDLMRVPRVQRFIVRASRDEFTISADASGALLHLRGWRQAVAKAPMRETLAASLLIASGWDPLQALVDPFCGSGTIAIEAALMARRIAPGRARRFAMETWPAINSNVVSDARKRAVANERKAIAPIIGRDRDAGAIAASIANAGRAGVAGDIAFEQAALSTLAPDGGAGWLVTNPPYGERIGEREALRDLYTVLGRVLRERRPGWHLAMLSADRRLEGQVGIAMKEVARTTNGGIPVRVVRS
jgi:putative N6-adenine-specific DNA methylase